MKTLDQWLDDIFSQKHTGYGQPLSRLDPYFKAFHLDNTIAPIIINVTGTNGKGSVVRLLEAIYLASDLRVAAMTSPHLNHFCERLTLNGTPVDESQLIDAFKIVKKQRATASMNAFDFFTIALLLCAKEFKPDILLIEAGVGGRLDVSNRFDASCAVITSIGLDHANLLGDTRESVAYEKVQLARMNRPLICGEPDPPSSIAKSSEEIGSTLYQINNQNNGFSYKIKADSWDWQGPNKVYNALPIPSIKLQNAATALMTVQSLFERIPVKESAIRHGLKEVRLAGRFEVVQQQCPVILDVAHNAEACRWLKEQLALQPVLGDTLMVFGMVEGKPLRESLQALNGVVSHWYIGTFLPRKSYSTSQIKQELEALGEKNCYTSEAFCGALKMAFSKAKVNDRIVVCGSFLAVAAAKQFLEARQWNHS